jgi:hypothetical protein
VGQGTKKSARSKGMETSAEACWRLSKACGQWAVESRDSAARIAFREMATAWARLAFNEEFTSPVDERIDPPTSENSEATPVEILASSLLTPSSENAQPEVERDWTKLVRNPSQKPLVGTDRTAVRTSRQPFLSVL